MKVFSLLLTLILICLTDFFFIYIFTHNGVVNHTFYLLRFFITPIVATFVLKRFFRLKTNIVLMFIILFIFYFLCYGFFYEHLYSWLYELLHGHPFSAPSTLSDNFNNSSGTPE